MSENNARWKVFGRNNNTKWRWPGFLFSCVPPRTVAREHVTRNVTILTLFLKINETYDITFLPWFLCSCVPLVQLLENLLT
jgi:hypothetical protein